MQAEATGVGAREVVWRRSAAVRYGIAVAVVVLVVALRLLAWPVLLDTIPYIPFAPAIMVAAWYGGMGPGLVATILSSLATDYFLLTPYGSLGSFTTAQFTGLAVFVPSGILISWLTDWARTASVRLEQITSDLRAANTALRQSESRLNTVVESLDEGVIVLDLEGNLLHWNRAAMKMHELNRPEEARRHLSDFRNLFELSECDGRVLPPGQGPVERILAGEELRDWELHIRRLDRDWERIYSYGGTLIRDDEGQPLMAVLTISDITERRRAEETLRRSREDLNRAQAVAHVGSWRLDVRRNALQWSDEAYRIFGVSPATPMTYEDFLATIHPEDREKVNQAWAAALQGAPYEIEHRIVVGDTVKWVREKAELEFDAQGELRGGFGTVQDVTARKCAEEEIRALNEHLEQRVRERTAALQAANAELRAAYKELEEFSYSISHDLRTPLRSIDGFSKLLLDNYPQIDATGQDYLRRVRAAAQRMGRLIDDILGLLRAGRAEIHRGPVDLSAMAGAVLAELRQTEPLRRAEITIQANIAANGDASLLRVVLQHLMDNAWKFTRRRPLTQIRFTASIENGERVYCVSDNGVGFDATYAHKLFTPFQRLHTEPEYPGTGIGLALVHRIIQRHGGRVWAEGAPDQGATFCFTLGEEDE